MFKEIGAIVAAERLRQARRVEDLGVDPRIVEALESGRGGITTTQFEKIAAALQLDPKALRSGRRQQVQRPSVFFRQIGMHQDFSFDDDPILDAAIEHAQARNDLARMVGSGLGLFPSGKLSTQPVAANAQNAAAHQGYQLARDLRRSVGSESSPLADLRMIAESLCGCTVLVRRLSTIGSTAIAVKAGSAAAILITPDTVAQLREPFIRAWIAHELCHVMFDVASEGLHLSIDLDDESTNQSERRARAFAAEFLLPLTGLNELLGNPREEQSESAARKMVSLARDTFGCTWQITVNHLHNHGFLSKELRAWLERQQTPPMTREWATPLPLADGPSLQVSDLTKKAYSAGHLTDGEVRHLLGLELLAPLPWDM
jgi:hypothetical protein